MMSFKRTLVAATIVTAFSSLARADDNVVKINQDGDTHTGLIEQTGIGNIAGNDANDIEQRGVDNVLALTQSGDDNAVGLVGEGLKQAGTASTDSSPSNSATISQASDGNVIGELVQTTLGAHTTTGNVLTVIQEPGGAATGNNTLYVVNQQVESGASSNIASVTQTGDHNWVERLDQHATSADGDNRVVLTFSGSANGVNGAFTGHGELAGLSLSAGAAPSEIVQGSDASGGAHNAVELVITGNWNQFGVTQLGTHNTIGTRAITGFSNSFAALQLGAGNQINGGAVIGDSNDLGIRQVGDANTVDIDLLSDSSDNRAGVGQSGEANHLATKVSGNRNVIGLSQLGLEHTAAVAITGDDNALLGVQVNEESAASAGNTLKVSISGSGNNAVAGTKALGFTGAASEMLEGRSFGLSSALVVAPDVGNFLGYGETTLEPGEIVQWGESNDIAIAVGDVLISNHNVFAVLQKGNGNSVDARIDGAANQVVALQIGDDNVALVVQTGDRNIAAISQ